jgi:hypothetical protein
MTRRRNRVGAWILAVLVIGGGCGDDSDADSDSSDDVERVEGVDAPDPHADVLDEITVGPLDEGTFTASLAPVPITFTTPGSGWHLLFQGAPGVMLSTSDDIAGGETPQLTISVLFDSELIGNRFPEVESLPVPLPHDALDLEPIPDDLAAWFGTVEHLEVGEVSEHVVDGLPAATFDVSVGPLPDEPVTLVGGPQAMYLFTLPDDFSWTLLDGSTARITVIEHPRGWIVVAVEPYGDEDFAAVAHELVSSLRFGET